MPLPILFALAACKAAGTAAAAKTAGLTAATKCASTGAAGATKAANAHYLPPGASRIAQELSRDDDKKKR
jgi:hypothetical protein